MTKIISWTSPSGEVINFHVCNYYGSWNDIGGIYMMCGFNTYQGMWEPVYIGKADSFKTRLQNHEKWIPAVRRGAIKILAFVEASANKRDLFERMLIRYFNPELNKQLKLPPLGSGI